MNKFYNLGSSNGTLGAWLLDLNCRPDFLDC